MLLNKVLKDVEIIESKGNLDIEITNISSDSRIVKKDCLFFAIKGYSLDGTKFINKAIENGATGIVVDETTDISELAIPDNITIVKLNNIRITYKICLSNY